ncbi:hypothetical protein ACOSQ3_016219 [Xanthoceras sorbifolium]
MAPHVRKPHEVNTGEVATCRLLEHSPSLGENPRNQLVSSQLLQISNALFKVTPFLSLRLSSSLSKVNFFGTYFFGVKFEYLEKRILLFKVGGLGLMRIVRGMQRSFREEQNDNALLGWKKSFSQGIGVTVPKARTRDKPMITRVSNI